MKLLATAGLEVKVVVTVFSNHGDFFVEVQAGLERFDLLEQVFREFFARADGNAGDVVDRFVGI